MPRYDEKQLDVMIHEVTGLLDSESLFKLSPDSQEIIRRHASVCPDCQVRRHELLDAYQRSLPSEKRARLEAVAHFLAAEISEKAEETHYLQRATADATARGKPELIVEAQERVRKRQSLFSEYKEAFKSRDEDEMRRIAEELRGSPLNTPAPD